MKIYMNNRGVTIPIVLIVLLITIIFGLAIMSMISTQAKINTIDDASKKAFEYAEAGYNDYMWHLNDDVNFYSTTESKNMQNIAIPFREGFYKLEVTKPSDTDRFVTIKSTGWTKNNPSVNRTILAKIRKKQFVHHVYVSDSDGENIWWTSGDESHGPYHTNETLRIQKSPKFYDTVTYSSSFVKGTGYSPDFKVKDPIQPQKVDRLEFPKNNEKLKEWAEKDDMVFQGRTCIYLDGKYIKIRNGNDKEEEIIRRPISEIGNKVIYVEGEQESDVRRKFNLNAGNVFISGKIEGKLTIAASNNIYITYDDPTKWYEAEDRNNENPPVETPLNGGIYYYNTTFTPENELSVYDSEKKIYTRYANGKDMLGLIANNDVLILHFGWPKYKENSADKTYWSYKWEKQRYWDWGWKYRWIKNSFNYDVAPHDISIHAAIFAVTGGFGYEDYEDSNWWGNTRKGNITLWGNITQKTRKAVGLIGSTGYNKLYAHDPRMFYDYPPHILEPTNVGWEIHEWKEIND